MQRVIGYRHCLHYFHCGLRLIKTANGAPVINNMAARLQGSNEANESRDRGIRLHCPHCNELVSKATLYRHKARYYDHLTKTWRTTGCGTNGDSNEVLPGIRRRKLLLTVFCMIRLLYSLLALMCLLIRAHFKVSSSPPLGFQAPAMSLSP